MKIKERVAEWEIERNQQRQTIAELLEKLDKLYNQVQDNPHLTRLQTEMMEFRSKLEAAETKLAEAETELATLKQMRPAPENVDDTPEPAPAPGVPNDDPPAPAPNPRPRQKAGWF